jgi:AcrR family transcriptional regulator
VTSAGAGKQRGPYAKTALRRADIVERASEAFARNGFQGTSLREIADAAGLTQPGVMHHFPTKDALLTAVLQAKDEDLVTRNRGDADRSASQRLQQVVRDNADNPGLVRLYAKLTAEALTPDHPAHEYFRARYATARELFADAARRAQDSGEIRRDLDPKAIGILLTAVMDGLQLQWLMDDDAVDMPAAFDALLSVLAPSDDAVPRGRGAGATGSDVDPQQTSDPAVTSRPATASSGSRTGPGTRASRAKARPPQR